MALSNSLFLLQLLFPALTLHFAQKPFPSPFPFPLSVSIFIQLVLTVVPFLAPPVPRNSPTARFFPPQLAKPNFPFHACKNISNRLLQYFKGKNIPPQPKKLQIVSACIDTCLA